MINLAPIKKPPKFHLLTFLVLMHIEKFPEGGLKEITKLLKLCGISVHVAAGMNCPITDFRTIAQADADVILCPERCKKTAEYLRSHFPIPVYETGGMPDRF